MSSNFPGGRDILDKVYLAAADPVRWPEVLEYVADHVGALGGFLTFNAPLDQPSFLICGRLDEEISRLSVERYLWNPWTKAMAQTPASTPVLMSGVVEDMPALRASAFWADVQAPQGIEEAVAWVEPSLVRPGSAGGFGFCLGQRAAARADEIVRKMTPLLPHLSRSLDISLHLGRYADGSRQLERALGLMPGAALLLDGQGRIMYANPAAESLLRRGDGLGITIDGGSRLAAAVSTETQALSRGIQTAISVAAGAGDRLGTPLRLSRPSGRAPLVVLLAPLPPPAFALWQIMGAARVLVLIADPEAPPRRVGALRAAFGLTAAEARVADLAGSGLSASQIAVRLGVSMATFKTQISCCYAKTGVRSQAEFVRLLSIFPSEVNKKL